MNLPNDIMYNASFNKDASFEGVFWMGEFSVDPLVLPENQNPKMWNFSAIPKMLS